MTIALVKEIHQFVNGSSELPLWFPRRTPDGRFILIAEP